MVKIICRVEEKVVLFVVEKHMGEYRPETEKVDDKQK
jgi:hypothetical protein